MLYVVIQLYGGPRPAGREWGYLAGIGSAEVRGNLRAACCWAEQYAPSGFTSVLEASLRLITIGLEVFVFRQQRFRLSLTLAHFGRRSTSVLLLLLHNVQHVARLHNVAVLGVCTEMLCGTGRGASTRIRSIAHVDRTYRRGGHAVRGGTIQLSRSVCLGEMHPFLAYFWVCRGERYSTLVVAGSLVGFSAFVWLLGRICRQRASQATPTLIL